MLGAQGKPATETLGCAQEAALEGAADPGSPAAARLGAGLPAAHAVPGCCRKQCRAPPALCVRVSSFRVQRLPKNFLHPVSGNGESPAPSTSLANPGDARPWMRRRRMRRQHGHAMEHFHQCSCNLPPIPLWPSSCPAGPSSSHPYAELRSVRAALGSGSTGSLAPRSLGNTTSTRPLGSFLPGSGPVSLLCTAFGLCPCRGKSSSRLFCSWLWLFSL